ncbi:MAG: alpha/beta hydrolase [Clostridiales bacterium]|nr:alpha/beta hydrolase [Clostridiales bacterium]
MSKGRTKAVKTILITFAAVAAVAAVGVGAVKIYDIQRTQEDRKLLERFGLYHPVDVGGNKLNVVSYGSDEGHTIVFISGLGVEDMSITYRPMTDILSEDNRIVFVDRAGYGMSGDTGDKMTADKVVKDYRKALEADGIDGPYVLVAHSLGGMYATYWESHYPEDIEGVVFLDGTQLREDTFPEGKLVNGHTSSEIFLNGLGLYRFSIPKASDIPETKDLNDEEVCSALSYTIGNSTLWNRAMNSEYDLISANCNETWDSIVANDIPKTYICATWASDTDQKYIDARNNILWPYLDKMGNCNMVLLPGIHLIYEQRPAECAGVIEDLLKRI